MLLDNETTGYGVDLEGQSDGGAPQNRLSASKTKSKSASGKGKSHLQKSSKRTSTKAQEKQEATSVVIGDLVPHRREGLLPAKPSSARSRGDLLDKYFREVSRHPLLSREKEHELALRLQESNDQRVAYRLITANLRLVVKIAKEYQSAVANVMDLIQEGNVGLIKAVTKYDPHKGVRLATYAQWWIRAYILKYLVNNARLVKVGTTQAQRKLFFSLNKEKNRLKAAGFKPDASMIANNLGVGVKEVKEMEKRLSRPDLSMDITLGDEQKSSIGDLLASSENSAEDNLIGRDLTHRVKEHLDAFSLTLQDREKVLWEKRLMSDERMTLREIGDMFGLTRERARQIEKGMLLRLREYLKQELPELAERDVVPTMQSLRERSSFDMPASF
jgi:RNA polymerase sigma-32 factor